MPRDFRDVVVNKIPELAGNMRRILDSLPPADAAP